MSSSLLQTSLRNYQNVAIEKAKLQSLIVLLPTGSGKTLIAAGVSAFHANQGRKVLFLVPTCMLVQQQAKAIRNETGLVVVEYMGGVNLSSISSTQWHVIVSTPAAFLVLTSSDENFRYSRFGCVIFDEVHHVIKKHPYRKIARGLSTIKSGPKVLGLTASLTYALDVNRIQSCIDELCLELRLTGDCIFTASTDELVADGYQVSIVSAVDLRQTCNFDINEGIDQLEIPGLPHSVFTDFMACLHSRKLHPLSLCLMDSLASVETIVRQFDPTFVTPVGSQGKFGKSSNWGVRKTKPVDVLTRISAVSTTYLSTCTKLSDF